MWKVRTPVSVIIWSSLVILLTCGCVAHFYVLIATQQRLTPAEGVLSGLRRGEVSISFHKLSHPPQKSLAPRLATIFLALLSSDLHQELQSLQTFLSPNFLYPFFQYF